MELPILHRCRDKSLFRNMPLNLHSLSMSPILPGLLVVCQSDHFAHLFPFLELP